MIKAFLRKLDIFGYPVSLKYQGKHQYYKSAVGGCLSILFTLVVIVIIVFRIFQLHGVDNILFTSFRIESQNKSTSIGSLMAIDTAVGSSAERSSISLTQMALMPYVLVYESGTGRPARMG